MKLTIAHGWDKGRRRELNEDSYLIWQFGEPAENNGKSLTLPPPNFPKDSVETPLGLFLVADGIGGAAAGEVASQLAVETIAKHVAIESARGLHSEALIKRTVEQADEAVRQARQHAGNDMGTTLVGALVAGSMAYVVNVGDSRAYLVSPNAIRRISHDHSYVQYLVDSGQIDESEVRTHPQRNIITRSIGDKNPASVDLFPTPLEPNDCLLLCSDGLWEMVEDAEIQKTIDTAPNLAQAATTLVDLANEHGGADNISVILIQVSNP